jgi:hypothetical protein
MVFRPLGVTAEAAGFPDPSTVLWRRVTTTSVVRPSLLAAPAATLGRAGAAAAGARDVTASSAPFESQVSAGSGGKSIRLASGDYGTRGRRDRPISVKAPAGAKLTMEVTFGSRPNGFALDGITGMDGNISPGPQEHHDRQLHVRQPDRRGGGDHRRCARPDHFD